MNVLVVGANGQLGAACCRALVAEGHTVRGSVRSARARGAGLDGVELVEADLARDPDLDALLAGIEAVVITANIAAPRAGDDLARFTEGEHRLIDAAGRLGVTRIVLPVGARSHVDAHVPIAAERRRLLEEHVPAAVPGSVILRFPPFMEVWLALVGSSLPLRGEPHATIGRPSPFLRTFRGATGSTVEKRGLMLVPGPTSYRQAFIAVADVAAACAAAAVRDEDLAGRTIEVGRAGGADLGRGGGHLLAGARATGAGGVDTDRGVRGCWRPCSARSPGAVGDHGAEPATWARPRASWTPGGGGLVEPDGDDDGRAVPAAARPRCPAALPDVAVSREAAAGARGTTERRGRRGATVRVIARCAASGCRALARASSSTGRAADF